MNHLHGFRRPIKAALLALLFSAAATVSGQTGKIVPNTLGIMYRGEMVTHPGLDITAGYRLTDRVRTHGEDGEANTVHHRIDFLVSAGGFYHRQYQSAFHAMPGLSYERYNGKGNSTGVSLSAGYMHSWTYRLYEEVAPGEYEQVSGGHNYVVGEIAVLFGKDLQREVFGLPARLYIRPGAMIAYPSFPSVAGYFMLEAGIHLKIKNDE